MTHALLYEDDAGMLEELRFDILRVEEHDAPTDVTEFPVEQGADINDNVVPGVKRLKIEGFVSNKPLLRTLRDTLQVDIADFLPLQIQSTKTVNDGTRSEVLDLPEKETPFLLGPGAVTSAVFGAIDSLTSGPVRATYANYVQRTENLTVRTLQQPSPVDRIVEMQNRLNDIRDNSRIMRVISSLEYYEDMVIERRVSKRTKDDGTGATFTLDLVQVKFVTTETVDLGVTAAKNPIIKKRLGSRNPKQTANENEYAAKLQALEGVEIVAPEYLQGYLPAPEFL